MNRKTIGKYQQEACIEVLHEIIDLIKNGYTKEPQAEIVTDCFNKNGARFQVCYNVKDGKGGWKYFIFCFNDKGKIFYRKYK